MRRCICAAGLASTMGAARDSTPLTTTSDHPLGAPIMNCSRFLGFVTLCLTAVLPATVRGQGSSALRVAAHRVTSARPPAEAPARWEGRRACARAVGKSAVIGSAVLGAASYVLGRNITSDRNRLAQGTLIGAAGGATIGAMLALSETPCWPWN